MITLVTMFLMTSADTTRQHDEHDDHDDGDVLGGIDRQRGHARNPNAVGWSR